MNQAGSTTAHMSVPSNSSDVPTIPLPTAVATSEGNRHLLTLIPFEEGERYGAAMETWFQACSEDAPFALEILGTSREQRFLLRASSAAQMTTLFKQFVAQYPQAEITHVSPTADPLRLLPGEHALVGTFALLRPSYFPLKTWDGKALAEPGTDPLLGILAALEPLGEKERVITQLALVRAPDTWVSGDIRKAVEHPLQPERDAQIANQRGMVTSDTKEGMKLLACIGVFLAAVLGYRWYQQHNMFALFLLGTFVLTSIIGSLWWLIKRQSRPLYDMKLVAEKLVRAGFYTQLRVIAIGERAGSTEEHLYTHLQRLETAYRQFSLASSNGLYLKQVEAIEAEDKAASHLVDPSTAFPYWRPLSRFLHGGPGKEIWNSLELAGAFHLPQEISDLPLVRKLSVKQLLFPPELAAQIEQAHEPLRPALIGYSAQGGRRVPVLVPYSTLMSHKFLVARSRYGKSSLMQLLLTAVLQESRDSGVPQPGVFIIDPHHDLIEDILLLIPPHRANDVLLLDFTDKEHPVGLNPLDACMGFSKDQAVSNLMGAFERIWADFWGPRMSYFLRQVLLLLYTVNEILVREARADAQYTLLDIIPVLQHKRYAVQVLSHLDQHNPRHQELMAWWQTIYFKLPEKGSFKSEIIMPIISKLSVFQDNELLRRIVGQPVSRAPIQAAVYGKIVLCALSSRDMDDASVNVLGSTLINLLRRSFRLQEPVPISRRRKIFVAIDEFQAFAGADLGKLLSEDAKFGCACLLATQYLKQLNTIREGLLETVLGNCETLCAFNVSAADARILEEELQKKVSQKHIISQPRLHCYVRLALPNAPMQIVSVALSQPVSWARTTEQLTLAEAIRQHNRRRFPPAQIVDQQYDTHIKRFLDVTLFAMGVQEDARKLRKQQARREADQQQANQLFAATAVRATGQGPGKMLTPPLGGNTASLSSRLQPSQDAAHPSTSQAQPAKVGTRSYADQQDVASRQGSTGLVPASGADQTAEANDQMADETEEETDTPGGKPKRSHPRSRRQKRLARFQKAPVGEPPPELDEQDEEEERDDQGIDSGYSVLGSGRAFSGSERGEREGRA